MIVNIRGTSGSGKTYFVRGLIEKSLINHQILDGNRSRPLAHMLMLDDLIPVFLIGSYLTVCGGCDTITSQDLVCSCVRHFSQFGHVIFEGLIISHLHARYASLCRELQSYGERYVWAYLNTPLDVCLRNVDVRRAERGVTKPLNPKNTVDKWHDAIHSKEKAETDGFETAMLDYQRDPYKQLMKLLKSDDGRFSSFASNFKEESFRSFAGGHRDK